MEDGKKPGKRYELPKELLNRIDAMNQDELRQVQGIRAAKNQRIADIIQGWLAGAGLPANCVFDGEAIYNPAEPAAPAKRKAPTKRKHAKPAATANGQAK